MQGNIGGWTTWPRCFPVQPSHKAVGMCFSQMQCLQFFTDKIKTLLKHVNRILILFGPYLRRMSLGPLYLLERWRGGQVCLEYVIVLLISRESGNMLCLLPPWVFQCLVHKFETVGTCAQRRATGSARILFKLVYQVLL